jgi:hypothetical protein
MTKKIALLLAAFGLTISAHARLGWTLEHCQANWGEPILVSYDDKLNAPSYQFDVGHGLFVQVSLLAGKVQSIAYIQEIRSYLDDNALDLLLKNNAGHWQPCVDDRAEVFKSRELLDADGSRIDYALLSTYQTKTGTWYVLQISTQLWNTLINNAKDPLAEAQGDK